MVFGTTYYISPTGNDGVSGTTEKQAWKNFSKTYSVLDAGDTLVLLDGTYFQSFKPEFGQLKGKEGKPIVMHRVRPCGGKRKDAMGRGLLSYLAQSRPRETEDR